MRATLRPPCRQRSAALRPSCSQRRTRYPAQANPEYFRNGSGPDGFRCVAPTRASIPESADRIPHPGLRYNHQSDPTTKMLPHTPGRQSCGRRRGQTLGTRSISLMFAFCVPYARLPTIPRNSTIRFPHVFYCANLLCQRRPIFPPPCWQQGRRYGMVGINSLHHIKISHVPNLLPSFRRNAPASFNMTIYSSTVRSESPNSCAIALKEALGFLTISP